MMDIPAHGSVVAVMAHPDDVKSVTGILRRAMAQGSRAALVLMTRGEGLRRDELAPDLILTHHPQDDHPDHRAVSAFVRGASLRLQRAARPAAGGVWAPLVYCGACAWPPPGEYFLTDEVVGRFAHLEAYQFPKTDEEHARIMEACRIFMASLGEAYVLANVKRDEVVWRIA